MLELELAETHGDALVLGALAEKNPIIAAAYAMRAVDQYETAIKHADGKDNLLYQKALDAIKIAEAARGRILLEKSDDGTIADIIEKSDNNVKVAMFESQTTRGQLDNVLAQLNRYIQIASMRNGHLYDEDAFNYRALQKECNYLTDLLIKQYADLIPVIFEPDAKKLATEQLERLEEVKRRNSQHL